MIAALEHLDTVQAVAALSSEPAVQGLLKQKNEIVHLQLQGTCKVDLHALNVVTNMAGHPPARKELAALRDSITSICKTI